MSFRYLPLLALFQIGLAHSSECLDNFLIDFKPKPTVEFNSQTALSSFNERQRLTAATRRRLKPLQEIISESYQKGRVLRGFEERISVLRRIERPSKEVTDEIHDLTFKIRFANEELAELNNRFLTDLQAIYKKEGITSELEQVDGSLVLKLDFSKPPSDEHAFEFYRNISSRFGLRQITLSLKENAANSSGGFFMSSAQRLEMGPYQGLALLEEYANTVGKHEARHAMFFAKRNSGDDSIFHTQFFAPGEKILGDGTSIYQRYMSVEEIYTYSTDLQSLAQVMRGNFLTDPASTSALLEQVLGEAKMLRTLSNATSEASDSILSPMQRMLDDKAMPGIHVEKLENGNFEASFPDAHGRFTTLTFVSAEERALFTRINDLNAKKVEAVNEQITNALRQRNINLEDFSNRFKEGKGTPEEHNLISSIVEGFDATPQGLALVAEADTALRTIVRASQTRLQNIQRVASHQVTETNKLERMIETYKIEKKPEQLLAIRRQMFFMGKAVKEDYSGFILNTQTAGISTP